MKREQPIKGEEREPPRKRRKVAPVQDEDDEKQNEIEEPVANTRSQVVIGDDSSDDEGEPFNVDLDAGKFVLDCIKNVVLFKFNQNNQNPVFHTTILLTKYVSIDCGEKVEIYEVTMRLNWKILRILTLHHVQVTIFSSKEKNSSGLQFSPTFFFFFESK